MYLFDYLFSKNFIILILSNYCMILLEYKIYILLQWYNINVLHALMVFFSHILDNGEKN